MAKKFETSLNLGTPLSEIDQPLKVVLYGRHGTGKTTAAAEASSRGPILIIDAEGGLIPQALAKHGAVPDNISVWPPRGTRITAELLSDLHRDLAAALADDPSTFHTIVFDSITEIHHLLRENASQERISKSRVVVDPDHVDRDDYNKMTTQLRRLIRLYRDLPCNIVFTALERVEDSGEIRPALSPALGNDLMGYVDLVGRVAMHQGQSVARFQATKQINAKDRVSIMPEILARPTLTRLVDITSGKMDLDADADQLAFLEASAPKEKNPKNVNG